MERKLFGIDLGIFLSRTAYAAFYGLLTIIIFYELPDLFLKNYTAELSNLPLDNSSLFLSYAILITILSGVQIVFQDHYVGDAAAISNGIAQIFYIYIFTSGGLIVEQVSGATVSLNFSTLIYLMMLPSALAIVSSIISASSRSSVVSSQLVEIHLE
jgi:hypothetical protein